MSGWHNVFFFSLLPSAPPEYYVKIFSSLKEELESDNVLTGPTTPVLVRYSYVTLTYDGRAQAMWHTSITLYVVSAGLRLLAAAHFIVVVVSCLTSQMDGKGSDVHALLSSVVRLQVNDISFVKILRSCSIENIASLAAYCSPSELAWACSIWHNVGICIHFLGPYTTSLNCN